VGKSLGVRDAIGEIAGRPLIAPFVIDFNANE
jgi:hypothetical protein